jgi:hypothetical protein
LNGPHFFPSGKLLAIEHPIADKDSVRAEVPKP